MAIPILWRTTKERYSLQGEKCPDCARVVFPPRRLCPYCGGQSDSCATEEKRFEFAFVLPASTPIHSVNSHAVNSQVAFSSAGDD